MRVCATIVDHGSPGYLNVLAMLFAWNAIKFAALAAVMPYRWLTLRCRPPPVSRDVHPQWTFQTRRSA